MFPASQKPGLQPYISDQIQARTHTDVFEKFPFQVKNNKNKLNVTTVCWLIRRRALKRQEIKQPVSDRG